MIEQQENSFTFVYQKPFIQHDLQSNFQIERPVNITLFCNCGPDNNNMLLTGSGVVSFATIKQQFALEGGIPSQHGNYAVGITGTPPDNLADITSFPAKAQLKTPSGSSHISTGSITPLIETEPDVNIAGQYLGIIHKTNQTVVNLALQFSNQGHSYGNTLHQQVR